MGTTNTYTLHYTHSTPFLCCQLSKKKRQDKKKKKMAAEAAEVVEREDDDQKTQKKRRIADAGARMFYVRQGTPAAFIHAQPYYVFFTKLEYMTSIVRQALEALSAQPDAIRV